MCMLHRAARVLIHGVHQHKQCVVAIAYMRIYFFCAHSALCSFLEGQIYSTAYNLLCTQNVCRTQALLSFKFFGCFLVAGCTVGLYTPHMCLSLCLLNSALDNTVASTTAGMLGLSPAPESVSLLRLKLSISTSIGWGAGPCCPVPADSDV